VLCEDAGEVSGAEHDQVVAAVDGRGLRAAGTRAVSARRAGWAPPPPPFRTKWTRLVHPSVLIGHDVDTTGWGQPAGPTAK
jgi:hypothetical protein